MILKLSRQALILSLSLGGMILIGVILLFVSPVWSELELYRSGLLLIALGSGISGLVLMVSLDERAKAKRREERPQRTMHKRLQKVVEAKKVGN